MKKRHLSAGILVVAIIALVALWWRGGEKPLAPAAVQAGVESSGPAQGQALSVDDKAPVAPVMQEARLRSAVKASDGAFDLEIEAFFYEAKSMRLTAVQKAFIAAAYKALKKARLDYEASIARLVRADGGVNTVSIPAYKEQGDRMLDQFYKGLSGCSEPIDDEKFEALCDARIRGHNLSFGACDQMIEIEKEMNAYGPMYIFTHAVVAQDGKSRGATVSRLDRRSFEKIDSYNGLARFFP